MIFEQSKRHKGCKPYVNSLFYYSALGVIYILLVSIYNNMYYAGWGEEGQDIE